MDARFGLGVSGYSEDDSGVKVELSDGSSIAGCALLACDGWKSPKRAQMLPDDPVHFCGTQTNITCECYVKISLFSAASLRGGRHAQ